MAHIIMSSRVKNMYEVTRLNRSKSSEYIMSLSVLHSPKYIYHKPPSNYTANKDKKKKYKRLHAPIYQTLVIVTGGVLLIATGTLLS